MAGVGWALMDNMKLQMVSHLPAIILVLFSRLKWIKESRQEQIRPLEAPGSETACHHLCHTVLAKASPKSTPDSRGGKKDATP